MYAKSLDRRFWLIARAVLGTYTDNGVRELVPNNSYAAF